jgi:hypothetical protein
LQSTIPVLPAISEHMPLVKGNSFTVLTYPNSQVVREKPKDPHPKLLMHLQLALAWFTRGFFKSCRLLDSHNVQLLLKCTLCQPQHSHQFQDIVNPVEPQWCIFIMIVIEVGLDAWRSGMLHRWQC